MIFILTFNYFDKNSYDDYHILVTQKPIIPMPQRRVTYEQVDGRDGSLTIDDETYENFPLPIACAVKSNNLVNDICKIKAWLAQGEGKLILSDESDKYYLARVVNKFDIGRAVNILGEFVIVFDCKPFKYSNFIDDFDLTEPHIICNTGTVKSNPVLKIYGTGDVSVTINGNTFRITNLADYVTVDSEIGDCYKDTQPINNNMYGDFPIFLNGDNTISWTGNITKISIKPNWRWL